MSEKIRQHMASVKECTTCHGSDGIIVPALDLSKTGSHLRVLLLGEQPSREAESGRRKTHGLWKDPDLELLRQYVEATGLPQASFLYATAVLCMPKDEKARGPRPSTDEARNCGKHIRGLIHAMEPELVVTLGHTPLLTLQHTYRTWTELRQFILNYDVGRSLTGKDFTCYPLYFPSESTLKARGERRQRQDWLRIPDILEARRKATVG
ncbi:hypothetical protein K8I85_12685 [bacterium]|nr:hypothetical protein [bacterium]